MNEPRDRAKVETTVPVVGVKAGQVWRSVVLRDYAVRLIRPLHDDFWLVEPHGSSAYGGVTTREQHLLDPSLYVLDTATLSPPVSVSTGLSDSDRSGGRE